MKSSLCVLVLALSLTGLSAVDVTTTRHLRREQQVLSSSTQASDKTTVGVCSGPAMALIVASGARAANTAAGGHINTHMFNAQHPPPLVGGNNHPSTVGKSMFDGEAQWDAFWAQYSAFCTANPNDAKCPTCQGAHHKVIDQAGYLTIMNYNQAPVVGRSLPNAKCCTTVVAGQCTVGSAAFANDGAKPSIRLDFNAKPAWHLHTAYPLAVCG